MSKAEEYRVCMRISTIGLVPDCQILRKSIKAAIETYEPTLRCSGIEIRKYGGSP